MKYTFIRRATSHSTHFVLDENSLLNRNLSLSSRASRCIKYSIQRFWTVSISLNCTVVFFLMRRVFYSASVDENSGVMPALGFFHLFVPRGNGRATIVYGSYCSASGGQTIFPHFFKSFLESLEYFHSRLITF